MAIETPMRFVSSDKTLNFGGAIQKINTSKNTEIFKKRGDVMLGS
jgi:hypothetical protein